MGNKKYFVIFIFFQNPGKSLLYKFFLLAFLRGFTFTFIGIVYVKVAKISAYDIIENEAVL